MPVAAQHFACKDKRGKTSMRLFKVKGAIEERATSVIIC
jgi:hypothetical protein